MAKAARRADSVISLKVMLRLGHAARALGAAVRRVRALRPRPVLADRQRAYRAGEAYDYPHL